MIACPSLKYLRCPFIVKQKKVETQPFILNYARIPIIKRMGPLFNYGHLKKSAVDMLMSIVLEYEKGQVYTLW